MDLIGFTIPNIKDYDQDDIANFIHKYCLFKSPAFAREVLDNYNNLFFYSMHLTTDLLDSQLFAYEPIYRTPNVTCISTSLYKLRMACANEARTLIDYITLEHTAYRDITVHEQQQLKYFIEKGYIRTIPALEGSAGYGDYYHEDYSPMDYLTPIS